MNRLLQIAFPFFILSVILSFAFTLTEFNWLFVPEPYNLSYNIMLIHVTLGFPVAEYFLSLHQKWNSFDIFYVLLPFLLSITNYAASAFVSATVWLLFCIYLTFLFYKQRNQYDSISENSTNPWPIRIFLILVAIAFFVFPVSQDWTFPQMYVRWHPYSIAGELVWRGIIASYAVCMLITCWSPYGKHRNFLFYLFVSGTLHSTAMLVMNLVEMSSGGMNGNAEHLFGDIVGWYVIAFVGGAGYFYSRKRNVAGYLV